jgi:hypothetical protein
MHLKSHYNHFYEESLMKQKIGVLCLLILVLSVGLIAGQDNTKAAKGEKKSAKTTTVTGEVVDVSCYLAHGEKGMGDDHASCAAACAKAGGPLGILTKDKKLYVSVLPDDHSAGPNAQLIDHVGHQVSATGILRAKGGVNGIMISKVEMPAGEDQK